MLVLFETPAGFALFKVLNEKKLKKPDDLWKEFQDGDTANQIVKLKAFRKFADNAEALEATAALVESKLSKSLKKFLEKQIVKKEVSDTLALCDAKLGGSVKKKLGIDCVVDNTTMELIRGIRNQMSNLITSLNEPDLRAMQLGLSHSLSRHRLKFSAEKVDTMIVQAIGLLDEMDKELNTYAMRVREWYGWHFPEMVKVVMDNVIYAKIVKTMGFRSNAATTELSTIIDEETEQELKEAAQVSMGTEVSEEDMTNIQSLCDQVIDMAAYRTQLYEYLQNRMRAVAPNLTTMIGELVGARLIAHAGSLLNLAKHPASTVQILGAEKALFRALKTKHETPKYGLIYHASLIGQAAPKLKGKVSRVLAAKCALSCRVDALTQGEIPLVAVEHRAKVESRLRQLEGHPPIAIAGGGKGKTPSKYDHKRDERAGGMERPSTSYAEAADSTLKSEKKKKKKRAEEEEEEDAMSEDEDDKKKKKKKKRAEPEEPEEDVTEKKKKKKKKNRDE